MNSADVIGYAYEAAIHCTACTRERFGPLFDEAKDREGNPVTAVFPSSDFEYPVMCDTCNAECAE